jgi:hypothetical protein
MAIQYIRFKAAGRRVEKGLRGHEQRWLDYTARTTTAADNEETLYLAGPFALGGMYIFGGVTLPACVCQKVKIGQDPAGDRQWSLHYEFDTIAPDEEKPEEPNPLNRPPKYSIRKEQKQRIMWKDHTPAPDGPKPVVNSALGRFAQPVMENRSRLVIVVTRNEAFYNIPLAVAFFDTVNDRVFWGNAPNHALCESITASKVWERYGNGEIGYWEVAYELHFDRDGWDLEVLDEGTFERTQELVYDHGEMVRRVKVPRDHDGIPYVGPILLDGHGAALSAARIAAGDVEYLTFKQYDPANFDLLNLPYPQ